MVVAAHGGFLLQIRYSGCAVYLMD
jgi:hypothetical protein